MCALGGDPYLPLVRVWGFHSILDWKTAQRFCLLVPEKGVFIFKTVKGGLVCLVLAFNLDQVDKNRQFLCVEQENIPTPSTPPGCGLSPSNGAQLTS